MENEPPTKQPDHSEIERLKSLVIVNTGDGKGKSTSAFGVIFRALGRDWDTAVIPVSYTHLTLPTNREV